MRGLVAVLGIAAFGLLGCALFGADDAEPEAPAEPRAEAPPPVEPEPEPEPLPPPGPDVRYGVDVVDAGAAASFHARTQAFYARLSGRRFNSIATFEDAGLREFFRSEQAFSDWFADFAQDLVDTHFEKSRPLVAEVVEWSFDEPGRARVIIVMKGDNGLPLRWWETVLEREDRWERTEGRWWIVPGKL